jgi:hypothetical protein
MTTHAFPFPTLHPLSVFHYAPWKLVDPWSHEPRRGNQTSKKKADIAKLQDIGLMNRSIVFPF